MSHRASNLMRLGDPRFFNLLAITIDVCTSSSLMCTPRTDCGYIYSQYTAVNVYSRHVVTVGWLVREASIIGEKKKKRKRWRGDPKPEC